MILHLLQFNVDISYKCSYRYIKPRVNFITDFAIAIQFQWKIAFNVTPLKHIISLQNFAHAMTAQLSCPHVRDFIAITSLHLEWKQNHISIEFELQCNNLLSNGLQDNIAGTMHLTYSATLMGDILLKCLHLLDWNTFPNIQLIIIQQLDDDLAPDIG